VLTARRYPVMPSTQVPKYLSTYLSTFWVLTYFYLSTLENWYLVLILKYLCRYL